MRAALHLIEHRRWKDIGLLVEPVALGIYRERRLEEARLDALRAQEAARADLRGDPDLTLAIEDYFGQSPFHEQQRDSGELRHAGGRTLEELERMSAAELLGDALRALDPRPEPIGEVTRFGTSPETQPLPRRVLGEVISGDTAYVLYTSQWAHAQAIANLAVLQRTRAGWALLPHGELFGHSAASGTEVSDRAASQPMPLPVRQADWLSRTFQHNLTADLFPAVLERLRGTPARLTELTSTVDAAWRTARPDGKWSLQEHVGHLLDLETLGEQRLDDFEARAAVLTAADMSNRRTHEARHNDADLTDLLQRFRVAREHLVARLASLTPDVLIHSVRHPRLDRYMNLVDWMFFMCEHDDHHLARIREQLADLASAGLPPR